MLDVADIPREALKNFGDHNTGECKRLDVSDHPPQLVSGAPRGGTEKNRSTRNCPPGSSID